MTITTSSTFRFIEFVFIIKKFRSTSKAFIEILILIEIFIDFRIESFFRDLIILSSGYAKQMPLILFLYFFTFFNNFLYNLYLITFLTNLDIYRHRDIQNNFFNFGFKFNYSRYRHSFLSIIKVS